jgi:hypothetical protein
VICDLECGGKRYSARRRFLGTQKTEQQPTICAEYLIFPLFLKIKTAIIDSTLIRFPGKDNIKRSPKGQFG